MNDVIFEQDKELQRPYTAKALLSRAKDPHLVCPLPKVNPGNWLCNLLRTQRMSREQIIEKVADDLWLTLEKRDGVFVFRFPDVWDTDDVQDMQRRVLEGIAMLESQRSLIVWLRDLFDNFSAGMVIIGIALLLGTIYAFSVGSIGWGIALFLVALLCCSVKISVSGTDRAELDLENAFPLGGSHVKRIVPSSEKLNAWQAQKTLVLMKELEAELEERSDPTRKTIPWGEPSRKAITDRDKPLRSDDGYEEPQAAYPSFDTDDLPPAELFGSHEQALHAWVVNKGYWPYCTPISARKQQ